MLTNFNQPNSHSHHHRLHYMCLVLLEVCLRIPSPQLLSIQVGFSLDQITDSLLSYWQHFQLNW